MRLYALTELHDPEAIELFITEDDAKRALEDCLRDDATHIPTVWARIGHNLMEPEPFTWLTATLPKGECGEPLGL